VIALRVYASAVRVVVLLVFIISNVCLASAFQNAGNQSVENNHGDADADPTSSSQLTSDESELYTLVNQERKNQDLPLFTLDNHLIIAARKHSREMAKLGKLSHKFADELALAPRLAQAGAHFDSVAENVANSDSPQSAHTEFMHSPGHRANLLNPAYNAIGIGIVEKDGQIYVTEDFSHRVPEQTAENIEAQILKEMNQVRSHSGLAAFARGDSSQLRAAACKPGITPHAAMRYLPVEGFMVVFSQAEARDLPVQLKKVAEDPVSKHVAIGVCYPPESQQGFAMFTALVGVYK